MVKLLWIFRITSFLVLIASVQVFADKKLWSLNPVTQSEVPNITNDIWALNNIDKFILRSLEDNGLKPSQRADRRSLIRRASYDLTGLPPSPETVNKFINDPSNDSVAFTKVIDRLLKSDAYGEKWGRHWLDLVRYADTAGENSDHPVEDAWRYRNWVIESFNDDKPY
ncbi:MAG: hypothetical protein CMO38_00520, partial [Verrucomicrobiaceae bacterium]|nr:hypothetical protein [Verrucomicrobiaceae bacterium]